MAGVTFNFESGLNDSVFGKSVAPIRSFIESRTEAFENNSLVKSMFRKYNTKNWGDQFSVMSGMRGFVPGPENASFPMDEMQEGYSAVLTYVEWRDSFSVTRKAADDGTVIDLTKRPTAFMKGYERTREEYAAATYGAALRGLTSHKFGGMEFDVRAADGVTLFNNKHPSKIDKKLFQTNVFSDEFNEDTLGALETHMQNIVGDNGEILAISPDTIMIPNDYQLKKTVFQAIGSDKDPDTSNNGWNYHYGRWNIIVNPYLNKYITKGTTPWMLFDSKANEELDGAVWGDRVPLEIDAYVDKGTKGLKWDGYSRFAARFVDWRPFAAGGIGGADSILA